MTLMHFLDLALFNRNAIVFTIHMRITVQIPNNLEGGKVALGQILVLTPKFAYSLKLFKSYP